jgi:hypothetical protein
LTFDDALLTETPSDSALPNPASPNFDSDTHLSLDDTLTHESISLAETPHSDTLDSQPLLSDETSDTISEQTFNDELLLDESGMGDMLDTPTARQDLSQLSSLSDKADTNTDDLLFSDTLDDSFLTDTPMLLDDASPSDALSESPTHLDASSLDESQNAEPHLTLPDLDFSFDTPALDDTLPSEAETSSSLSHAELASQELTFNEMLSLNDSTDVSETLAAPTDAQSKSLSSSDFLQQESYDSELLR